MVAEGREPETYDLGDDCQRGHDDGVVVSLEGVEEQLDERVQSVFENL